MNNIPFYKYTAYGNSFVIIDELAGEVLDEASKAQFAALATDPSFGIGSDNFLVLQRCDAKTLAVINRAHRYWDKPPLASDADFIFRMFEPNGDEALCCGNGLLCIAEHLNKFHGIDEARIMVEVPLPETNTIALGSNGDNDSNWILLNAPRLTPATLYSRPMAPLSRQIDYIDAIEIDLGASCASRTSRDTDLRLSGYLVFSGEPHLVIVHDEHFAAARFEQAIFGERIAGNQTHSGLPSNPDCGLFTQIGAYINERYKHLFPQGINVNIARVASESGSIEYRCFERGIHRETLACGTGALAVAFVFSQLQMIQGRSFSVLPHRCRWQRPTAAIGIEKRADGWVLSGSAELLITGHTSSSNDSTVRETKREPNAQKHLRLAA